jgi:hypothetical protein
MPMIDENYVKVCGCTIVWDGITAPDKDQNGQPKYKLKLAVPSGTPDVMLLEQLAQSTLQASQKFQGVLPPGGRMPVTQAQPGEYNNLLNGYMIFNAKTGKLPDVYSETGQLLDIMQYGQLLYGGQQVDVLVHCYDYDNMGNKGIGIGLDGFAIIASAQAPRQSFGTGGINTANVFGGGGAAVQQNPVMQPPVQQPQQFAQQQPQQFAQQQPQQFAQQQPQQFAQQQHPVMQPPAQMGSPMQQYQSQQPDPQQSIIQPMQAHNMLPTQ